MNDLRERTISGVGWSTAARMVSQVAKFSFSIALVRLLTPGAFGNIAMAMVVVGLALVVNELGFGAAIIQRPELDPLHPTSAFWVNAGIGVLLTAVVVASAPYVADFYRTPSLERILPVLSILFLIRSASIVPLSMLKRKMHFEAVAKAEVVGVVGGGVVAVGLAIGGAGVWSLVAQHLTRECITVTVQWWAVQWRPRLAFAGDAVADLFGFSIGHAGFNFVNYWARKSDDVLIGRYLGAQSLGAYDRAYRLMLFPLTQIIQTISRVMFPALSSIQSDVDRVRRIYLKTMGVLALVIFPAMFGLWVVAEPFVQVVFGEKWLSMVPILEILSLVGALQTLTNPTGWIYKSQGRTDWMFYWGVGASTVLILSFAVGIWFGSAESVAWAYLIANLLILYPCIHIPGKLIDLTFTDVIRATLGPLLCALGMTAVLVVIHQQLSTWSALSQVLLEVGTGAILYTGLVWGFGVQAFRELRLILSSKLGLNGG